jgi:hypothetical protein
MPMTLALLSPDQMLPPPSLRRAALSQWFTPQPIAKRMAEWAGDIGGVVLEPSFGSGALIDAWIERCEGTAAPSYHPTARIDAVELDPRWADLVAYGPSVHTSCGDYLARPAPSTRYALGLTNPPYEGGLDGLFLAKLMDECDRVIALVRLAALAGGARHEAVWSRVERNVDGWWMPGLAVFSSRPVFEGPESASGSAKSDFVCVKLSRIGEPGRTAVEWW